MPPILGISRVCYTGILAKVNIAACCCAAPGAAGVLASGASYCAAVCGAAASLAAAAVRASAPAIAGAQFNDPAEFASGASTRITMCSATVVRILVLLLNREILSSESLSILCVTQTA